MPNSNDLIETTNRRTMAEAIMSLVVSEVSRIASKIDDGYKVIIFGAGARGIVLHESLKFLGREVNYFVDSKTKNTELCGIPVNDPLDILYEDSARIAIIVAAGYPDEMIECLRGLGIDEAKIHPIFDRESIDDGAGYVAPYPVMDFFLGHSRSYELPGFKRITAPGCEPDEGALRILVLGGSTTDPEYADIKEWRRSGSEAFGSWPKILHELLNESGIRNVILNGGIGAYTAAQQTFKFIRDGLALKPDLVVSLDGINDACGDYWHQGKYPKFHSYFATLEGALQPLIASNGLRSAWSPQPGMIRDIAYGIPVTHSLFDEWHLNQRTMSVICREFGIEYTCFLQPAGLHDPDYIDSCDVKFRTGWLLWNFFETTGHELRSWAKDRYSRNGQSQSLADLIDCFVSDSFNYAVVKKKFTVRQPQIEDFYRDAKTAATSSDYIVDLTAIYYNIESVYYDTCHVTNQGNKIIANHIFRELVERGALLRALTKASARNPAPAP